MATIYDEWKKKGFLGSAAGVGTYDNTQEKIKAQMNANSQAWHTADEATRDALHKENQRLAGLLGSGVRYDSASGKWSGQAEKTPAATAPNESTQYNVFEAPKQSAGAMTPKFNLTSGIKDQSSYLEDLYAAQKAAALSSINAAYEKNMNSLDRAEAGLNESYQNARNQAAGASELAKRNFAQYAAASGLNTGVGGQAELARNVTLQNNLNTINTQQAQSSADLALQRANAETTYNDAIVQAEQKGDYELANALYKEKVRVQEMLLEMQVKQAQLEYDAYRDSLSDEEAKTGVKMTLATAKDLASDGIFNEEVLNVLNNNGYDNAAIYQKYGYDPNDFYRQQALASKIPSDVKDMLMKNFPGGVITGKNRWRSWVDKYGEDAMRAAGFSYGVDSSTLSFAKYLYESTNDPHYLVRKMRESGYSDTDIDAAMAQLGL